MINKSDKQIVILKDSIPWFLFIGDSDRLQQVFAYSIFKVRPQQPTVSQPYWPFFFWFYEENQDAAFSDGLF